MVSFDRIRLYHHKSGRAYECDKNGLAAVSKSKSKHGLFFCRSLIDS